MGVHVGAPAESLDHEWLGLPYARFMVFASVTGPNSRSHCHFRAS